MVGICKLFVQGLEDSFSSVIRGIRGIIVFHFWCFHAVIRTATRSLFLLILMEVLECKCIHNVESSLRCIRFILVSTHVLSSPFSVT